VREFSIDKNKDERIMLRNNVQDCRARVKRECIGLNVKWDERVLTSL
jgi:hypothetical protein